MISEPGIYPDIPMSEYVADPTPGPALSSGIVKALLDECPMAAWQKHPKLNPLWQSDDSTSTDIGKLAHALLLKQPSDVVVVEFDDWRKKEARETRDKARSEGKTPILAHVYPKVKRMADIAREKLERCLNGETLKVEHTVVWRESDVWCKVRPDILTADYTIEVDYKTTAKGANPETASRLIANSGYDLQGCLVRKGIQAVTGVEPKILFLIQECDEPFLCSMVGLDPAFIAAAQARVELAMERWRKCIKENNFPGYPDEIAWVEPPPYLLAQAEKAFISSIPGGTR